MRKGRAARDQFVDLHRHEVKVAEIDGRLGSAGSIVQVSVAWKRA